MRRDDDAHECAREARSLRALHPELAAQWHPTANAPLTPGAVTPGSAKRVTWVCPDDASHVWAAIINSRARQKHGCPWCGGVLVTPDTALLARYPEVAKEWHPTRNGQLGPADVRYGSARRVWWRCAADPAHVWEARVSSRTVKGSRCPTCSRRRVTPRTSLSCRFPRVAKEWHPTRNDRLGPADVLPGSNKKVWWRCRRDPSHEWSTTVKSRALNKTGCPACAGRVATPATSLAAIFPEVAKDWHPTRNRRLGPGDVMPHADRKVWWQCPRDATHAWRAMVSSRTGLNRSGCPACANHMVTATSSLSTRSPAVAAEWHPTRNGRLRPDHVVPGSKRKVWWQCSVNPEHVWPAVIAKRTSGHFSGCPMCANRIVAKDNALLAKHPELARQWHPTRNGALTPAGVTPGSQKNVWWRCALNPAHEWRAAVFNRSRGSGCPDCYRESHVRRKQRGTERAAPDPALVFR